MGVWSAILSRSGAHVHSQHNYDFLTISTNVLCIVRTAYTVSHIVVGSVSFPHPRHTPLLLSCNFFIMQTQWRTVNCKYTVDVSYAIIAESSFQLFFLQTPPPQVLATHTSECMCVSVFVCVWGGG